MQLWNRILQFFGRARAPGMPVSVSVSARLDEKTKAKALQDARALLAQGVNAPGAEDSVADTPQYIADKAE